MWPFNRKPVTASAHPMPPDPHPKGAWRENFETLCEVAIFVLFARTFVFQNSQIPSGSMVHTLEVGDHILTNSYVYGPAAGAWEKALTPLRDIKRGDIIVFKFPGDLTVDFVKRAIAFEGETVLIYNNRIFVRLLDKNGNPEDHYTPFEENYTNLPPGVTNGEVYPPPACALAAPAAELPCFLEQPLEFIAHDYDRMNGGVEPQLVNARDDGYHRNWGPYKIPRGHLLAMGDNRENSLDGRVWGALDLGLIKGKGWLVWWSFDDSKFPAIAQANTQLAASQTPGLVKLGLFGKILAIKARHFLDGTRWERTFFRPQAKVMRMKLLRDQPVKIPPESAAENP